MANKSFIGKGVVYAKKAGGALLPLGNVSSLELGFDEEKKELLNFMSAGGGVLDSVSRVSAVTLSMTCSNFDLETTLNMAMRGTVTATAGGSVVGEVHSDIVIGGFIPFDKIPNTSAAIVVKEGATTLTVNVDYTLEGSGIVPKVGGLLINGDDITVDYTSLAFHTLESLTTSGDEYELVFDGLNEARSGKAFRVTAYRCKFSPLAGFGLIADDFGEYEIDSDILADTTKSGAGISQYFILQATD